MNTTRIRNSIFIILFIAILIFAGLKILDSVRNNTKGEEIVPMQEGTKVMMYIKSGCRYCILAKELLVENNIEYEAIDLSFDIGLQEKLINQTKQFTVPYIFIDNKFIGGYADLRKIVKNH